MTEKEEQAYLQGRRALAHSLMVSLTGELAQGEEQDYVILVRERDQAIRALRELCECFGLSNTWSDNLHLADIIEKHVARSLGDK